MAAGGNTQPITGIGSTSVAVESPLLTLDEISIPAGDFNVGWKNVDVLIIEEVAGLDGIFGMNMLLPAVTLDLSALVGSGDLSGSLEDIIDQLGDFSALFDVLLAQMLDSTPGYFDTIIFETTGADTAELRLFSTIVPDPSTLVLLCAAGPLLLMRKR